MQYHPGQVQFLGIQHIWAVKVAKGRITSSDPSLDAVPKRHDRHRKKQVDAMHISEPEAQAAEHGCDGTTGTVVGSPNM